jgi:hypothetical protein
MTAPLRSARLLRRHWKLAVVSSFSLSIALALGILGLSIPYSFFTLPPAAPEPSRLVFTDIAAAPNSIGALGAVLSVISTSKAVRSACFPGPFPEITSPCSASIPSSDVSFPKPMMPINKLP